ncbi:response regulator transcription factor [Paraburkholderia megapolitana]|nr:response regulator transcription factor [Paraburkholderia megapolitana]QDQ82704.1 response regulator transcription factor [Paraburkholderia megapolitana]
MKQPIRVIVADDHSAIRACVHHLLSTAPHMSLVGTACDAGSLAELYDTCRCDVIVADIGMPGANGESSAVSLLRRILRDPACPPVVVLTMLRHPPVLSGLLVLGVSAIVDKRDTVHELIDAIEAARTRTPYLSERVQLVPESDDASPQPRVGMLSVREWEVFQFYARGFGVSQIATTLGRSVKTVSTQKRNAMRKLGLETDAELIGYANQIGLA